MRMPIIMLCTLLLGMGSTVVWAADATAAPTASPVATSPTAAAATPASPSLPTASTTFSLEQFGPITTVTDAQATYAKAMTAIKTKGGGTLLIPKDAPATWNLPENINQESWRTPDPPAPAARYGFGVGVTVIDNRNGTTKVQLPQLSGMEIQRTLRLPEGESMGSWEIAPMIRMNNTIVRGSTSYRDWLKEDVPAGKQQRFYLRTLRGVFPGIFLNISDAHHLERIYVQSIGYDKDKQCPYLVADTPDPLQTGALFSNKNHVNLMFYDVHSHTEEQTCDLMLERHKYSQGDDYLFSGRMFYMSDVHSTAGDENGNIIGALIDSDTAIYHGKVIAFNAKTNELKFDGSSATLGTGRPMINLNPKKWITQGTLIMVRPGNWTGTDDPTTVEPVFQGKTYPTSISKAEGLRIGGLMRFTADAPLSKDIVGRYFAVDQDDELVPNAKLHRWYYISGFTVNPDGSKEITVVRHWWGAKTAQSVTLYKEDNYSWDGHVKPLKYIIAPGANVYDVADAVKSPKSTVKVAPGPDTGMPMDFAPGDPIEQAIGPDPFRPTPFRSWTFELVPGIYPSTMFDVRNDTSAVMRTSVMSVAGSSSMDSLALRYDRKPSFDNVLLVHPVTTNVITFDGDVVNAALYFKQPNHRAQPMKWLYADSKKAATLTVSPDDGTLQYSGGNVVLPSVQVNGGGLSASATPAHNLRGLNLPVPAGSKELPVKFPQPEADNNYMVTLQLSWLTIQAVTNRTPAGFTVQFATPPATAGELSWMLVR